MAECVYIYQYILSFCFRNLYLPKWLFVGIHHFMYYLKYYIRQFFSLKKIQEIYLFDIQIIHMFCFLKLMLSKRMDLAFQLLISSEMLNILSQSCVVINSCSYHDPIIPRSSMSSGSTMKRMWVSVLPPINTTVEYHTKY